MCDRRERGKWLVKKCYEAGVAGRCAASQWSNPSHSSTSFHTNQWSSLGPYSFQWTRYWNPWPRQHWSMMLPFLLTISGNNRGQSWKSVRGEKVVIVGDVWLEFGGVEFGELLWMIGKDKFVDWLVRPGVFDKVLAINAGHEFCDSAILLLHVIMTVLQCVEHHKISQLVHSFVSSRTVSCWSLANFGK